MRKAALHNLGCKVNAYETEAMQQQLEKAGYEIVPFDEKADVYVVNTCSVTNIADKKSRQMLHRAKKQNPEAVVAAVGCYVQVAADKLRSDAAVDLIIGTNQKSRLAEILEKYFESQSEQNAPKESSGQDTKAGQPVQNILKDQTGQDIQAGQPEQDAQKEQPEQASSKEYVQEYSGIRQYENLSIDKVSDHVRAFIKIQDGCNQFCSYCIIPYARGRIRSRRPEDVLQEAERLAAAGFQELVLTGIHISSYGLDVSAEERVPLISLIERLDRVPGIQRLRLGSLEPRIVTEEFAERLSGLKTICPHFHLSLQSGSDTVLKRMNRHYTAAGYRRSCDILRKYFPNPAITTDVIVGFPGETEEEFAQTEAFIRDIQFYELHVFPYSRREGTKAAAMDHQIPEPVKKERSGRLLQLDREMSLKYRRSFLGQETEVLMEEELVLDGCRYLVGHTRQYVKAAVLWDEALRGQMVSGKLDRMLSDEVLFLDRQ